jgi:hypothetical protein
VGGWGQAKGAYSARNDVHSKDRKLRLKIGGLIGAVLLSGCTNALLGQNARAFCESGHRIYIYLGSDRSLTYITDTSNSFILKAAGLGGSADSDNLTFYVNRQKDGVVVLNYAALTTELLSSGKMNGHGLKCQTVARPRTSSYRIVCENQYGESMGYVYSVGVGITEFFLPNGSEEDRVILAGQKGLLENCDF